MDTGTLKSVSWVHQVASINLPFHLSPQKSACEAHAKRAKHYVNVTDVSQVVTERFLCTGGIDPEVDPNTCKGEE